MKRHIAQTNMSQAQAAQLFGVTQPRISDLMRGKINLFGLDALVDMASAAGLHVDMRIRQAALDGCGGRVTPPIFIRKYCEASPLKMYQ